MLKHKDSSAIVAVRDIQRARDFYEQTLGLEVTDDGMKVVLSFRTGRTTLVVYESPFAGTNQANAVVWNVGGELDAIAADLKGRGVVFEHYDLPDVSLEGDVHVAGPMRMVWFKDPDGNVLHLVSA